MYNIRASYRPLKIGWCVRDGNIDDLRKALHFTHAFWGGTFNPIIPIGEGNREFAKQLVNVYKVDFLHAVEDDDSLKAFVEEFPHLPKPFQCKKLFATGAEGLMATLADVYHPICHIRDRNNARPPLQDRDTAGLITWEEADPLRDVLLATFGSYPLTEEAPDYLDIIHKNLPYVDKAISSSEPIPVEIRKWLTPSALCKFGLQRDIASGFSDNGVYVGSASNYNDLVKYWNLRAANIQVVFYDEQYSERMQEITNDYIGSLRQGNTRSGRRITERVCIYYPTHADIPDEVPFEGSFVKSGAEETLWNGLNLRVPIMHFDEESILPTAQSEYGKYHVSFQMPSSPFFDDDYRTIMQYAAISIKGLGTPWSNNDITFWLPDIPELNEFYGRESYFEWYAARVEREGIGIICRTSTDQLTLRAIQKSALVTKIFEAFGMKIKPSNPGLICNQLIQQMEGVQGCRVFKIAGVRKLIENYRADQHFTKGAALELIGEVVNESPNFSRFEGLYIEQRDTPKLKPIDAFQYLLKKEVFRAGLVLECPRCKLTFWRSIDDIHSKCECEYCGSVFNITMQLKDRDWQFRRSGLFGSDNNQEGSIPVALTMQQIDANLMSGPVLWTTAMQIDSISADIESCETDFVIFEGYKDERIQLAIGECKTRQEITEEDVRKLRKVADAFPANRFDVYILFSKLAPFTENEINILRPQQNAEPRIILLTTDELEPYHIYENQPEKREKDLHEFSLQDLAFSTAKLYFAS